MFRLINLLLQSLYPQESVMRKSLGTASSILALALVGGSASPAFSADLIVNGTVSDPDATIMTFDEYSFYGAYGYDQMPADFPGENGGGATVTLSLPILTDMIATVEAEGGDGGSASQGDAAAGNGGLSTAIVSLTPEAPADGVADITVRGGKGGDSVKVVEPLGGGNGGNVFAELTVESEGTSGQFSGDGGALSQNSVIATGGDAGNFTTTPDALAMLGVPVELAKGGDASARFDAEVKGSVIADVQAFGGKGGDIMTGAGTNVVPSPLLTGYHGGQAYAALQASVEAASGIGSALYAKAVGGNGGNTDDIDAGHGGQARALAELNVSGASDDYDVRVDAYQKGGDGGHSSYGTGGNGAESMMDSSNVRGSTAGLLRLIQAAEGGAAGNGAISGVAGNAVASLEIEDDQASYLYVMNWAQGGNGGKSYGSSAPVYDGGIGDAYTEARSYRGGTAVDASAFAMGGQAGVGSAATAALGKAFATSIASGIGKGNVISAYSYGYGAAGGSLMSSSDVMDQTDPSLANKFVSNVSVTQAAYTANGTSALAAGVAGKSSYTDMGYDASSAKIVSLGNVMPEDADGNAMTTNKFGNLNGDFTVVGDGLVAALNESDDIATYDSIYSYYEFADLGAGNNLYFTLTGDDAVTTAFGSSLTPSFTSATFSLLLNGSEVFYDEFTSSESLLAALGKSLDLGLAEGSAFLELAMSNIVMESGGAFAMSYALAIAPSRTVTDGDVTNVPLPAAAPLFAAGIFGLGLWGRRRKSSNS